MRELGGQYSVAKDKRPQTFKEKDELSKMRTKERQLLRPTSDSSRAISQYEGVYD